MAPPGGRGCIRRSSALARPLRGLLAVSAAVVAFRVAQGGGRAFLRGPAVGPRPPALRAASAAASGVARAAVGPAAEASGKLTLRYFDGRGVAETSRILLALAGEDYEDKRYPISFGVPGDFSTIKREEFEADKAAGKMDVAMGKVPVLDAGDFSLPQSKAIERYLSTRFGLMGSTPEEAAWVDAVAEHVRDINDAYAKKGLFFMKDEEKKKEIQDKWFGEELPVMLKKLEAALPSSTEGFAVGSKSTYADVLIFRLLKDSYADQEAATFAEGCPKLQAIADGVAGLEAVSKWVESRPKTMF